MDELKAYQQENLEEISNGFSDIRKINGLLQRFDATMKLAEKAVSHAVPGSLPSQSLKEFRDMQIFVSEHHYDALYSMRYIENLGKIFQLALRLAEELSQSKS